MKLTNETQLLTLAYENSRALFKNGARRVSINHSTIGFKNENEDYLFGFLHIEFYDGQVSMYSYQCVDELLNIIEVLMHRPAKGV